MISDGTILKEKYLVVKEVGSGSFGKVYKVEDIHTGDQYAIKRVNRSDLEDNDYLLQAFWKELEVMKKCENKYSVKLVEHFLSSNHYNIVMELCDTDLEIYLGRRIKGFSEEELKKILLQLNNVFEIMDRENIIHRDLKLRNIMVIMTDKKHPIIVKLSDFGFSKVIDEGDITKTKLGTPATMAPEILMNKNYSSKADIWSLGVVIYQMLFKTLPFRARNEKDLLKVIINNPNFKIPDGYKISNTLLDLLKNLLQIDPKKRYSWKEYFQHSYFKVERDSEPQLDSQKIFEERYINMRKMSDDFSEYNISKAKDRHTGQFVLIKEISKSVINSNINNKRIFDKEIQLMKRLTGDSFITLIDLHENSTHYYIVTEHFEGRILENFIRSRTGLNESFVQSIIRSLVPGFKELNDNNLILDFISTKSFCFKYFKSQDDFKIKFFDYGLSLIFTEETSVKDFVLNELGNLENTKTNVLSIGMMVYKLLFGQSIYKFSNTEEPNVTISKKQVFKLPKSISKSCKHLIERTCNLNKEKRYDWNNFLEDSFVKIKYGEDVQVKTKNLNEEKENFISDNKIENLADQLRSKIECIINYFTNTTSDLVLMEEYNRYYKEMSIFIMLSVLEIKLFKEFIKQKEKFFEDEELHLIKISSQSNKYEYSWISFIQNNTNINRENPMLEFYYKTFTKYETQLIELVNIIMKKIDINVEEVESYDYIASSIKNYYSANIEKYFFKVFETGILSYTKEEHKSALEEFMISKYFLESVIFIRLIANNKKENVNFFKLIETIENEDEINLMYNSNSTTKKNWNSYIIFTFLGGVIKTFKTLKIMDDDINTESMIENSKEALDSLIKFYPEVIKMIKECSKPK